jgi:transcriptional regulator with XRE-family HTH domain
LDVSLVIRHRLKELGLEQRDLAAAAQVTESYISQLLTRKKSPPAPGRTDIYDKIGSFLRLPTGELSRLADLQRREDLKRKVADPPEPLFKAFRELILRKCEAAKRLQMQEIFEKEPFGALERLITQKLLDVTKRVAKEELESEQWLQLAARLSGQAYEQMRVVTLEFLDTDVFHVSAENCVSFLDPLIEFLKDALLSGDATDEEIEFLKSLRFKDRRPLPLYYYRVLQTTRDPLHFRISGEPRNGN